MVDRILAAYHRTATAADRVDSRHRRRSPTALEPGHAGVVATTWSTLRLTGVAVVGPLLGLGILGVAARNTRRARALIDRYPQIIEDVAAGRVPRYPAQRVGRVPAGAAYFVSSDLHRCVPGTVDWPGHQRTTQLYEAALGYYADQEWGLIENGDVEDFWLVGGSTYGVIYDIARLTGQVWRGSLGRRVRRDVAVDHLERIVAHNRSVYDVIDQRFHRHGRYHRTVGNHDDVFLDQQMVNELGKVHTDLAVHDFIVLADERPGGGPVIPVGVVTHGHHTDGWNAPHQSGLGKLGNWLASAVHDFPLAGHPGVPEVVATVGLLKGTAPNLLTQVSRYLGANRELYSLDETRLFAAWRRRWPAGETGDPHPDEPWLILGHTHMPLIEPRDPVSCRLWSRYVNSRSAIFYECLTGIEWDGTTDPRRPEVRLVIWRYGDHEPVPPAGAVVARAGAGRGPADREIVREVLARTSERDVLTVLAHEPREPALR